MEVEEPMAPNAVAQPEGNEDNQENRDPSQEEGTLKRMFEEGTTAIATHRVENLFQTLESSTLTDEQQKIIEQRVALQRKMFEQYEKRERQRKVAELQDVVPGLSVAEVERALELCDGREDDAASQLVSDPAFLQRVKSGCGSGPAPAPKREASARASRASRAPIGPRPKLVDSSKLGDSVFMGAFRGKGYTGAPKPPARPASRASKKAASAGPSSADPSDHEDNSTEEQQQAEGGGDAPAAAAAAAAGAAEGEEHDGISPAPAAGGQGMEQEQQAAGQEPHPAVAEGAATAKKPRSRRGASGSAAGGRGKRGRKASSPVPEEGGEAEGGAAGARHASEGEQQGSGEAAAAPSAGQAASEQQQLPAQTPLTVPRKYALAVETSDGGYRPVTDSELRGLEAEAAGSGGSSGDQPTPSSGPKPAGDAAAAEAKAASAQQLALAKSAALLAKMPEEKAVQWLGRMAAEMREGALEQLHASQPEKAATLSSLLEASLQPEAAPTAGEPADAAPAVSPAAPTGVAGAAAKQEPAQTGAATTTAAAEAPVPMETDAAQGGEEQQQAAAQEEAGVTTAEAPSSKKPGGRARRPRAAAAASKRSSRAAAAQLGSEAETESEQEEEEPSSASEGSEVEDEEFSEGDAAGEGSSSEEEEEEFEAPARKPVRRAAVPARASRAPRASKAAAEALLRQAAAVSGFDSDATADGGSDGGDEQPSDPDSDFEEGSGGKGRSRPSSAAKKGSRGGRGGAGHKARGPPSKSASPVKPVGSSSPAAKRKGGGGKKAAAAAAGATGEGSSGGEPQQGEEQQQQQPAGGAAAAGKAPSRKAPPAKKQKLAGGGAAAAAAAAAADPSDASAATAAGGAAAIEVDAGGVAAAAEGAGPSSSGQEAAAAAAPEDKGGRSRHRAISSTGHTCRGRVKQKSHKSADLVEAGSLRTEAGWHNAGYIFPEGFVSRTLFRSSVALDQLCVHECFIIGKGGQHWPAPTFKVVSLDRPDEPLIAKSCTGCWTGILKRINAEIEARRRAGEDLPPPPKTAIAGPEYFGLNQPNIQEAIEALDPGHKCTQYWAGKEQRERAAAGLPVAPAAARPPRAPRSIAPSASKRGGGRGRKRRAGSDSDDDAGRSDGGDEDETAYMTNRWSAVSRTERYKKRLEAEGEDTSAIDEDNPLHDFIDPITLEPVVRPAISPYGHVMGMATWKAVLAEHSQCPFTKQPLQWEQCKVLTKSNFHLYQDKIIR